jgi:acetolactate synthase I/II/III large subunit
LVGWLIDYRRSDFGMPDVVDAVCAMLEGMKAAELFVRCLESEGVERIFAVPGEENLDLIEALRESTIDLVVTRHEQSAGFMAAAQGRLTGKPGVCLGTLGPGATNLVTAAAYAELGAMPMVMITGQKPIKTSRQGHFQIVDVVDLMKPVTRYTRQVVSGATVPARVREAFRLAEEERPGATHLELPEDILREAVDAEPIRASQTRRPVAEEKAVARAVEAIEQARRPLLDDRSRGQPQADLAHAGPPGSAHGHPVFQHPDGQGRGRRE